MSQKIALTVTPREAAGTGAARRCRREGLIPAIIYAHGKEGTPVSISAREFRPFAHKPIHLVDLKDAQGKTTLALMKSMDYDYLKDCVVHIDFQEVNMNEILHSKVALVAVGTPAGCTEGGLPELLVHELDIACTAGNLPEEITLDVSGVALDSAVHIKDIVLPEGVKCTNDGSLVAFVVKAPAVEAEPEPAPAADAATDAKAAPAKAADAKAAPKK